MKNEINSMSNQHLLNTALVKYAVWNQTPVSSDEEPGIWADFLQYEDEILTRMAKPKTLPGFYAAVSIIYHSKSDYLSHKPLMMAAGFKPKMEIPLADDDAILVSWEASTYTCKEESR